MIPITFKVLPGMQGALHVLNLERFGGTMLQRLIRRAKCGIVFYAVL